MVIAQIHNSFKDLTDTEQKIANYVLDNPDEIPGMTVKDLALKCDTVQSAVVRFCKSVGFDGYSKFKIALAQELGSTQKREMFPKFLKDDDTEMVFRKIFDSGIRTLQDTLEMLDFKQVDKIVDEFIKAKRILIFGVGTSSTIATDASYRFAQFGLASHVYTDYLFMNVAAMNMGQGDVAFGISHSGSTKAVVDALRYAKTSGATTIALSSFSNSILCRESDYSVTVYADEENYPVEAVSAVMAQMCVIDAFMMTLGTKKYNSFQKCIEARNKILNDMRY